MLTTYVKDDTGFPYKDPVDAYKVCLGKSCLNIYFVY
jgi:hypothetical protein